MTEPSPRPTATYRLQLRAEFGFDAAAAVVPYLSRLGVSHLYLSPILQAVPGSAHGYDVVDHTRLSDDLGGRAGWDRLVAACRAQDLRLVVDVVPNHMAIPSPENLNTPLWDVLAHGEASSYASWFDIDWAAGDGKVLIPVLGRPLADCLRDGEIQIDTARAVVRYFDHVFPLAPGTEKLDAQHYRLAYWRTANDELNYRRFFDVTSLVGVRVEAPEVFAATHALVLGLIRDGDIDGLRIDHPDGLADPAGYLDSLHAASGGVWTVVEKILEGDERLPGSWACDGTTGYDAAAAVTGVLTDPAGEEPLTAAYGRFTGRNEKFAQVVEQGKRLATDRLLGAEIDRLGRDLDAVRRHDLDAADFTARAIREAIVELLVGFGVYRAYADDAESQQRIDEAIATAIHRMPERRPELDWLGRVLRREVGGRAAEPFVTRFEQTTGPAMAKGVEDTAFYRYLRLVALNEVGGDPGEFGRSVDDWHDYCARLARDWPATMTTLSTHDTKRAEDVRARLLVLAEIPLEWERAVSGWRDRVGSVDPNTDYLLWQTFVGAHGGKTGPLPQQRLLDYLVKAAREAKERTSWTDPDEAFERGLADLVARIYADEDLLRDIDEWVHEHIAAPGHSNSLAQKLLQLTMPGVPDIYQGQELSELSLVDPDNRRPVDYESRSLLLDDLDSAPAKLSVTARALQLRRERPRTFAGGYTPIEVSGTAAAHAVAFMRGDDVVTVATRLPVGLQRAGGFGETSLALPPGSWHDVLTGEDVTSPLMADVLRRLPVALLARRPERVS